MKKKILISFIISLIITVATFGAIYLLRLLILEVVKVFGTVALLPLITFLGVWVVYYLMFANNDY